MSKNKILLIDDDIEYCHQLALALKNIYDFTMLHSKSNAIHEIKENHFDLILLDLNIDTTNRDGFDLLNDIRELTPNIPIVILTNSDNSIDTYDALMNYKVADFISKSQNSFEELALKIADPISSMTTVFLSFSKQDRSYAEILAEKITSLGFNIFMEIKSGENTSGSFYESTTKKIENSTHFMCLISKNSINSLWLMREIQFAKDSRCKITSVFLDSLSLDPAWDFLLKGTSEIQFASLLNEEELVIALSGRSIEKKLEKLYIKLNSIHGDNEEKLKILKDINRIEIKTSKKRWNLEKIEQIENALKFRRNQARKMQVDSIDFKEVLFFRDLQWNLDPKMNVLLGKNGFGKTLLMRLVLIALSNDVEYLDKNFIPKQEALIAKYISHLEKLHPDNDLEKNLLSIDYSIVLLKDKEKYSIDVRKNNLLEMYRVGKFPILAISALRFFGAEDAIRYDEDEVYKDKQLLVDEGADRFIRKQVEIPRARSVVGMLISEVTRYLDKNMSSIEINETANSRLELYKKVPICQLLIEIVKELTDISIDFFEIPTSGEAVTGHAQVLVKISQEENSVPIPIQFISMGMQSIIYIFALIYFHLAQLHDIRTKTKLARSQVFYEHSIVFIDEIDAHLHPDWQQKITGLLRKTFPNVQFVLAGHSPFIISGSDRGQVAILRKRDDGSCYIEQFRRDFIGASISEILTIVYEVEERDDVFVKGVARIGEEKALENKLAILQAKYKSSNKVEERERLDIEIRQLNDEIRHLNLVESRFNQEFA